MNIITPDSSLTTIKVSRFTPRPNDKHIIPSDFSAIPGDIWNLDFVIDIFFRSLSKYNKEFKYISGRPTYAVKNEEINITVCYYFTASKKSKSKWNNGGLDSLNNKNTLHLSSMISNILKKKVNIILVRVYYPYINSLIFSKYLAINTKQSNFQNFKDSIFINIDTTKNNLPSNITGIKIKISGRILTEAIIPRVTTNSFSYGSFKGIDQYIDYNSYTATNRIGTFTIKVWICQSTSTENYKFVT